MVGGRETVTLLIRYYGMLHNRRKTVTVPLNMLREALIAMPPEPMRSYPQTGNRHKRNK